MTMPLPSKLRPAYFLPGIIWFIAVAILMFLPGKDLPDTRFLGEIFFDKLAHIGCFGLLTLLWVLPLFRLPATPAQKWQWGLRTWLFIIVWGLLTEVIQGAFVEGRHFDLLDWLADSTGASVALLAARWLLKKRHA